MNDQISDKNVILIILATILVIFILVFGFKSNLKNTDNLLQWRESMIEAQNFSEIQFKKYTPNLYKPMKINVPTMLNN